MNRMDRKVTCPYCGAEMQKCVLYARKFYECPECFADSPSEKTGCAGPVQDWETATELALRRYQPENRVLTTDEINAMDDDAPVWHECRKIGNDCYIEAEVEKDRLGWASSNFGKDWRIWLRKPTEEERKAVLWDD